MIPEDVADRRTGFAVRGHIGKLMRSAELFSFVPRSDAASDVELLTDHILPDTVKRVDVAALAQHSRDIGHTRIHIGGTYRMTHRFRLFGDRQVRLVVRFAAALPTIR